jgi:hypothetical protein
MADTAELEGAAGIGARLADKYIVDGVRWAWEGVTYYAAHIDEGNGERVIIAERSASEPDPLADAGLMRPGETMALSCPSIRSTQSIPCCRGSITPES